MRKIISLFIYLLFITIFSQEKEIFLKNEYGGLIKNYDFIFENDTITTTNNGLLKIKCLRNSYLNAEYYSPTLLNCNSIKNGDSILIYYEDAPILDAVIIKSKGHAKDLIFKFKNNKTVNHHYSTKYDLKENPVEAMASYYNFDDKYIQHKIKSIQFNFNRSVKNKCLSELVIQPVIFEYDEINKDLIEVHFPLYIEVEDKLNETINFNIEQFNYKLANSKTLIGFKIFNIGNQKEKCNQLDMFKQSNFSVTGSKSLGNIIFQVCKDGKIYKFKNQGFNIEINFEK